MTKFVLLLLNDDDMDNNFSEYERLIAIREGNQNHDANGLKLEEYREIKPYWDKRLSKHYDAIKFINGYGNHRPSVLVPLIQVYKGQGIIHLGAPENKHVYILRLGKVLETKNYELDQ